MMSVCRDSPSQYHSIVPTEKGDTWMWSAKSQLWISYIESFDMSNIKFRNFEVLISILHKHRMFVFNNSIVLYLPSDLQ